MGIVTIIVDVLHGGLMPPRNGKADRDNQTIRWTIRNPPGSGVSFPTNTSPFVFPSPPPAGYDAWRGGVPTAGPGANQWSVDVNDVLPAGTTKKYKYDINYTDGNGAQTMDPEIENQGYPPLTGEKEEKDKKNRPDQHGGDQPGQGGGRRDDDTSSEDND